MTAQSANQIEPKTRKTPAKAPVQNTFEICGHKIPNWDYPSLDEVEALQALEDVDSTDKPGIYAATANLVAVVLECRCNVVIPVVELRKMSGFNVSEVRRLQHSMLEAIKAAAAGGGEGK
jgi:hypothetical protein